MAMTEANYRAAGRNLYDYFRELLAQDGNNAKVELHADHMRSLLAVSPTDDAPTD